MERNGNHCTGRQEQGQDGRSPGCCDLRRIAGLLSNGCLTAPRALAKRWRTDGDTGAAKARKPSNGSRDFWPHCCNNARTYDLPQSENGCSEAHFMSPDTETLGMGVYRDHGAAGRSLSITQNASEELYI